MPAAPRSISNDSHNDFIKRFTERESQKRVTKKRPKELTAAQRAGLRRQLRDVRFLKPAYADNSKINIAGILRKWKKYCESSELGLWKAAIETANKAMAMDFLDYLCDTYKITSSGTSWEYFRQYKQLYSSVSGRYIDTNDSKEIHKHDAILIPRYGLRPPNADGKPVLGIDDLLALLTFNLAYDTSVFPLEAHRVQLPGVYLGLAYTGARPIEIIDNEKSRPKDGSWEEIFGPNLTETTGRGRPKALCYEDVLLMVVRHPDTGTDVLAISIKFIHHKGVDNKPKPTIFFFTMARKVILCLITVIISQALRDQAFAIRNLISAGEGFQIRNKSPSICDMERQTLDAGFERAFGPKAFRRGAANAVNGKASDAVRDQMMRHDPKWATFNSAYINEKVQFDIQNVVLDEPSEDGLIRLFTHMSLMRDPRAAQDMVPEEVWSSLPPDPEIEELERQRAELKGSSYRIKDRDDEEMLRSLSKQIRAKRAERDKRIRSEYREFYFHNRPTWEEDYVTPIIELHIAERAELAEILVNQPDRLAGEELKQLRVRTVELIVALCHKRETAKRRTLRERAPANVRVKEESPGPDLFPLLLERTQYPRYIGDEGQSYEERTFRYCRPAVMYDHFDRKHRKELRGAKQISCSHPKCSREALEFKYLNHFKNHMESVHRIKLRRRAVRREATVLIRP
ncbi:FluG domain-containing protein [Lasiosphaeria ovina]|uniref:FluG domain-containing protein n=1 Tax=Lasiosphaeria ovina TaxID=92902 RepID=A0AAE0N5F5_9PEZI|nr:FluG domain-containing protein [Lasiosphaeria ovina]